MSRYFVRSSLPNRKAWDIDEDEPFRPNLEVSDHEAVETGLIAVTGEPIMRMPNPIGFGRGGEW